MNDDAKHDYRKQRSINGSIGLRVPQEVLKTNCSKYMKKGKAIHLPQRTCNHAYSIIAQYQAEYHGVVQYYRMAYNLHILQRLKYVTEVSLVKTLASKYKTTCSKIYKSYGTTINTKDGTYKVLLATLNSGNDKRPLIAYFGAISLKYNKWVNLYDNKDNAIWNGRR